MTPTNGHGYMRAPATRNASEILKPSTLFKTGGKT